MSALTSGDSPMYLVPILQAADGPGWLSITLAPGKKTHGTFVEWSRDLDADLARLRALGATTLVPLLPDHELERLGIAALVPEATDHGLVVVRFPFEDFGVPEELEPAARTIAGLCDRVLSGERLVVHCNGGLGRAGTVAACARLRLGLDPDAPEAIAAVRRLRSPRAIENARQEDFVARFHAWSRAHPAAHAGAREPDPDLTTRLGGREAAA